MEIVLKDEHLLADVSAMMSLELRRHFNHKKICLCHGFPHLNVHSSTECTRTNTLNSDPN